MKNVVKIALFLVSFSSFAQQMDMHTQYIFNEMLVNPGATGGVDYIPVQLNFRKQWASFPGAPTTQSLSCHSEVFTNMGFGGNFFNDNSGPSRRTGMNVNGAYHIKIDPRRNKYLGLGMGVSLAQHTIDETKLETYLPDDPAVINGFNNQLVPDANVGVFYKWNEGSFVGLSAYNLVQMKRDLFDFDNILYNPMVRTYYLFAGHTFQTESDFSIKTSTLVRAIETGTFQVDLNAIAVYRKHAWFGLSYRHLDAVTAMIGAQIAQFRVGYSYDYTISDIGRYSNGSHEVFLELHLYEKKGSGGGGSWYKRSMKYAPKI